MGSTRLIYPIPTIPWLCTRFISTVKDAFAEEKLLVEADDETRVDGREYDELQGLALQEKTPGRCHSPFTYVKSVKSRP